MHTTECHFSFSRIFGFFGLEPVKKWALFAIKSIERHFCWLVTSLRYIMFFHSHEHWWFYHFFLFFVFLLLCVCLFCVVIVVFANQQNYASLKGSFAASSTSKFYLHGCFQSISSNSDHKWIQKTICWNIKVSTFTQEESCLHQTLELNM